MFTNEELNTLLQLMDLATKAGGLAVAQQALPLVSKMQEMAKANDMSLAQSPPSDNV
jgi:hypothetical protein